MKSLRTDDIIGAKPRIRHPPKNLVHEQRVYQQAQFNPQYNNNIDDNTHYGAYADNNNNNTYQGEDAYTDNIKNDNNNIKNDGHSS